MAFEGWLLKINNTAFPTRLIALDSFKITTNQATELDTYRDGSGILHRNLLPHTSTLIGFSTTYLRQQDIELLNHFLSRENRGRCSVEYWNPNTSAYQSGSFYIADIAYEIVNVDELKKDILYKPITVTMTEY